MKHLIIVFLLSISGVLMAQTHLYENPNAIELTKDHKIIAIHPFQTTVNLRPKQMKDISPEQLAKMEQSEGKSVQNALYSWFVKREKRNNLSSIKISELKIQ